MSAWAAGEARNLVALEQTEILLCYNDWPTGLDDNTAITGWVTDNNYRILITEAPGEGHDGVSADTGFHMSNNTSAGTCLTLTSVPYVVIVGLGFMQKASSGGAVLGGSASYLTHCIAEHTLSDASGGLFQAIRSAENCLAIQKNGSSSDSFGFSGRFTADSFVTNCSAIGVANGFETGSGTTANPYVVKNCLAFECANGGFLDQGQGFVGSNFNASDDDTAPGTTTYAITKVDFIDYDGGDFTPAEGGNLYQKGAHLPNYYGIERDLKGNKRFKPWDIGPYELEIPLVAYSNSFEVSVGTGDYVRWLGPDVFEINVRANELVPDPTPNPSMDTRFESSASITFRLASGTLPAGVTIDPATGNLVGTPTEKGEFPGVIVRGYWVKNE
jgi:hypothetical protein